jgi:hypothetical protein
MNQRFCPPVGWCLECSTVLCLIFRHQNLLEDLVARQIILSLEKAEMVLSGNLLWLLPVLSIQHKFSSCHTVCPKQNTIITNSLLDYDKLWKLIMLIPVTPSLAANWLGHDTD